jgi:hypothetical protein
MTIKKKPERAGIRPRVPQSVVDRSQVVDFTDGEMSEWFSASVVEPLRRDISP